MAVVDTQAEIIHDMGTEGLQAELSGQEHGNGTLEVDECHPERQAASPALVKA